MEKWQLGINTKKTTYTLLVSLLKRRRCIRTFMHTHYLQLKTTLRSWDSLLTDLHRNHELTRQNIVLGICLITLIEKLVGTSWDADGTTLKRLYTGRMRHVLEFGITARDQLPHHISMRSKDKTRSQNHHTG